MAAADPKASHKADDSEAEHLRMNTWPGEHVNWWETAHLSWPGEHVNWWETEHFSWPGEHVFWWEIEHLSWPGEHCFGGKVNTYPGRVNTYFVGNSP